MVRDLEEILIDDLDEVWLRDFGKIWVSNFDQILNCVVRIFSYISYSSDESNLLFEFTFFVEVVDKMGAGVVA